MWKLPLKYAYQSVCSPCIINSYESYRFDSYYFFIGVKQMNSRSLDRFFSVAVVIAIALSNFVLSDNCSADEITALNHLIQSEATAYLLQDDNRIEFVEMDRGALVFQKFINDIPLHGGRVIVVEDADGQVAQVYDSSSEDLVLDFARPNIASAEFEKLLNNTYPNATGSDSKLVWFRIGNAAGLAWEVTTALADTGEAASPTGLETVFDGVTGEMLSQRQLDTKTYQPGSPEVAGNVFPRIVINNTIGAAGARAYAAPFDAVVEVNFGCTGTLIADNVVLSARHCGAGAGDTIIFGDNSSNATFSATVQSSSLPDGGGSLLDGGDVAILTLTSSVPANIATPMRLIDETNGLEGMLCATIGYGFNGLGSNGHGNSADGFRWGGENIIDVYGSPSAANGSNIISTDFDNGTNGANEIPGSSPTPVEFEATTAPGDSGGPVLVQIGTEWVIAGVLSGGTTGNSVFGDISWWTGTADFRSQIEAAGGVFAGSVDISIVGGLPDFISSDGGDTMDFNAVPDTDGIVPGSGTFHVNTGVGFQQLPLIENSATSYTAIFPSSDCLSTVQFFVSFELDSGAIVTHPSNAPTNSFSLLSAFDLTNTFVDTFDTNLSWAVTGNATDGQWQRAIPNNGDRGDPQDDAEADGNGFCFVTDNGNTGGNTNTDVDGGETILTSPAMDATGGAGEIAFLSYFRWYSNDSGGAPNADIFTVEISNNNGATWADLETIGPAGPGTGGGWIFVEHRIDEFVAPTSDMRIRFNASDLAAGSVIEAGVDRVAINLVACDAEVLHGDVNQDGVINLLDVQPFIDLLGNGDFQAEADVNKDGIVNLLDVTPFIELLSGP